MLDWLLEQKNEISGKVHRLVNSNVLKLPSFDTCATVIWDAEKGRRTDRNSLYYLCNFPVNLKLS